MENQSNRSEQQAIEIIESGDRRRGLVERFRDRQDVQRRTIAIPGRPEMEPGDERAFGGLIRRKSAEQKHHEQQMLERYYDGEEAAYGRSWALALEVSGVRDSIQAVQMEEKILQSVNPQSLAGLIGEDLVLESAARIKEVNNEAAEYYRKNAFRKR